MSFLKCFFRNLVLSLRSFRIELRGEDKRRLEQQRREKIKQKRLLQGTVFQSASFAKRTQNASSAVASSAFFDDDDKSTFSIFATSNGRSSSPSESMANDVLGFRTVRESREELSLPAISSESMVASTLSPPRKSRTRFQ